MEPPQKILREVNKINKFPQKKLGITQRWENKTRERERQRQKLNNSTSNNPCQKNTENYGA